MEGRYYLITGASGGIGSAVAELVSRCGGGCILIARDSEKLEALRVHLTEPDRHIAIPYDLNDLDHYSEIFEKLRSENVVLNGMVHCAGITKVTPIRTYSMKSAAELFNIHYFAFMELVKWYAKKGVSDGGSIVGISAINAHSPQKCMSVYASAKAAVEGACTALAPELSSKGIRINSVVVGGISGGMGADIHDTVQAASSIQASSDYSNPVERQLLGIGTPGDVAGVIAFMLSEESRFITGRSVYADGGLL